MSRTQDMSSRPWHCQNTQTSAGAGTREVNLREGEVTGRGTGLLGTMVVRAYRPKQHKRTI